MYVLLMQILTSDINNRFNVGKKELNPTKAIKAICFTLVPSTHLMVMQPNLNRVTEL